ncbi:MAG: glycosyltransferase family 1 protein [Nitrosomonas sp.]|nr:MAG: glycosyltransferase family 1 protein [Nitrosomonas sp.]
MIVRHCILFDQTDIFGKRIGGAETFLRGMIKYAPQNFKVSVVGTTIDTIQRPLGRWTKLSLDNREFDYLPIMFEGDENHKSAIPLSLRYTLALSRLRIDTRGKVLYFNRIEPSVLFSPAFCAKIVTIHNDIESQIMRCNGSEALWSKMPFLYKLFERYAFKSIDHLYTVSENSVRYYHLCYPDMIDKVSFLPTWLDPDIFSPSDRNKIDIRKSIIPTQHRDKMSVRWILFVGRLQEQKAPLRLIEAFKRYYDADRNSALLVVGDGNFREQMLEEARRQGLAERIIHIKYLPQSQLVDFYRAADVLLLVSNYEGMPISVLEAMGCGLPVVSTRVGEVPRVVKNGFSGEIIESFDAAEIAVGLKKVLAEPSMYTRENCLASIQDFVPTKVLEPVFKKMIDLCELKSKG